MPSASQAYGATERGVTLTGTPSQIAIADQKIQEILNEAAALEREAIYAETDAQKAKPIRIIMITLVVGGGEKV